MATRWQWLLLTWLGFCAAWMDERPVLESRDGNLFISAAKDKNITLKILGKGYLNVNEINLLHVANSAESATRLIERWKTGYLAEVESNLQRLMQLVEGPDGLEKKIAALKGFGEGNSTLQPDISSTNQSKSGMSLKIRMMVHRVRRIEEKVKSIETKLKINECSSNPCQNGGTCQDLYEGYQCHCPSNWEGPNCVIDVNECVRLLGTDLGCQNGATCHNLPGSYRCDCTAGWFGLHCTKKTPICNTQNSNELCGHGVCVSKPGSPLGYTCICDQGWQSEGVNPACVKDVDECAGNHRPCSVNPWVACRNAPGTFFCDACPQGYSGNGYYCTDIDECLVDNGGCSTFPRVQCINTMGSRMCGPCPKGYSGDGVICVYVGSCAINNGGCHPFATCVENPALTSAYVICRCPAGMVGDGLGPNGCQQSTDHDTPCATNPCGHGDCLILGTTPSCMCHAGYTGTTSQRLVSFPISSGDTCTVKDPCTPNPCKNNGVCVKSNGAATCDCPSSYTGNRCETPRQTCGGVSRNTVGHLEFPIGGNVYQHGLSCAWVLITNSSLVLNVTFDRFNLEQSTDCKYDFLQIHDGRNAGSQMIGRFCGNTSPHGNGNIVSSHNSLYFWFHSDNSISHDGFAFHWDSIKPVCGGTLTNDYGTISSPGSPGRYPPNRDCYWQITVRPSKRIQIHFGQLMLEEHPTCEADFLEITTIHNERLGLYCNHTHPPPLVVPASEAIIYFHSDSAGQDAGFQIHYSVIEGVPGCNDVYTAPTGTINSPAITLSTQELECEWKILMPVGKRIEITWPKFELTSTDCRMQQLEIYDGDTSESPLLQRLCGSMIPSKVRSNTNVLLIVFKAKMYGSFTLSYSTTCGQVFTSDSGIIKSPSYPAAIAVFESCDYEIRQPPDKRIVLNMLDINIPKSLKKRNDCYGYNYLDLYDGTNVNATRLAHLCGTSTDGMSYYSTHNVMLLKYHSMVGRGFQANYTTIQSRCGGLYTEVSGTIQTPTDDGKYPNDETCVWTILAPIGYIVQLSWLSFDLERNIRCRHDYVKVYENFMSYNREEIGTFCGFKKPPLVMTQGNELTLVFHSDSSITREGFTATYFFIDASKVCGGHFIKTTGVVQSPNYPRKYPGKQQCSWVIEAPHKQRVILNVTDFHLEAHSTCLFDYLEIRNGGYETSPLLGRFCGTDIPTEIISQTNQVYLKFVSDMTRSFAGFRIEWDSTTIGCGGTLNAAYGDIISPNYPEPYLHQAECYWKIAVAAGSLIRLLIVDLQLEQHDKCRYDYIEISEGINHRNSQRYCGNPYPKIIETKSNMMNIEFRSDFTNSGRGFHLKYETLCENKLHGFYGSIESPNFPYKYEHNLNCSWTIDAPIGNRVNITFSHFDLEGPVNENTCSYDYLQVSEGFGDTPSHELAKLCNSDVLPAKIHSKEHQVFVKFVTDALISFNGFRLEWVVDGCGGHLTRPFDSFTSPGYPSAYPTDVVCEWLIEVDYSHSIELTLHDVDTETNKDCMFDKLQIYSGEDANAPKLVEICYSPKPVVYTSFGNTMFIKFQSDVAYATRGFNASYRSVPVTCGGRFTTDTGVIFSKNYPKNYPNRQNCKWLIQVDPNYVVNITFLDFDIEDSRNCTDDYVQIYDGPTTDSRLLGAHCRNELPPSYVTSSNEMLVVMKTDRILSAKGFKASYHKACGARIVVRDQGYIVPSTSYTTDLNDNWNCAWILVAEDPADHVTVTFTHLDMGRSENWNYVEVFEGEGLDGPSRGKWTSNVIPLPITSNGNALTVNLHSFTFGNVSFTYTVLNSACGGTYNSYEGMIASPNYPNSYPLNAECIWILENSPGNKLSLTFTDFELQQSENCNLDYVEIREDSGIGKLINTFCGTSTETVRTSKKLWMKFKSDGDDVGKGFAAEFKLIGGDELSGPIGRITSPLYPIPYRKEETLSWRITVQFGSTIRIEITDLYAENFSSMCFSYLRVYDGYNDEAPVLLDACGIDAPEPITSSSNVVNIQFSTMVNTGLQRGNWFALNWLEIPKNVDDIYTGNVYNELSECNVEVALTDVQNSSYEFSSPGWPNGYDNNLRCSWIFISPPGTHLMLRILAMSLEETSDCAADFVAVYDGNALATENSATLLQTLCFSNSTQTWIKAGDLMTVKFQSDSYLNKTGFSAYVYRDCGGKMSGPNGVIEINNTTLSKGYLPRSWQVLCEWVVTVRPGRMIEVKVVEISIAQGPSFTCTDNYLMLKNGGEASSPLLGVGKYCGSVAPLPLETTGNRLYVKAHGERTNIKFKLTYREVSTNCGGEFYLSNKQKEWEISTPNYPNIPPPYSECTWTAIASGRERIFIHFVDRFDLSSSVNCEKEYVEVRDGGTDSAKLFGRYCKDVAPSSMISTQNMMYVRFYTDVPEPKNGFKAVFSIKESCGGIIRSVGGIISSPNYPFFYPKNQTCVWRIIAPEDHTLKFSFLDLQLPGHHICKDYVQITEVLPMNKSNEIGTYCGFLIPDVIETASNEAIVTFKNDNIKYATYRGFSLNFTASQEICGGEFTAMQGTIKSNGYPNIATRSHYCDWKIKLPRGYHIVVEIQDLDIMPLSETRMTYALSFYNDFRFRSRIKVIRPNSTDRVITSSSNTMMIGYYSSPGYRGFKLRYYADAPAPCGGEIHEIKGNLTAPRNLPFNESSYFCLWSIQAPQSLVNVSNVGLTLSIRITGAIGGILGASPKFCFHSQYVAINGIGMICGNYSEPVYLRSPKLVNDLIIVNGTYGKPMRYKLEYEWQPCGGVLRGLSHVVQAPKNISYPINCVWHANYPDNGEMIKLHFNRLHLGGCGKNYISVRNGGPLSPEIGRFCGSAQPYNITSTSNQLWIEYTAVDDPNDFEFVLEPANNGCGGAIHGTSRELSSPKFPAQYPNNAECIWEITADNGYHIGLVFVDRFNLEGSHNCEKDYVQIFDWVRETNGLSEMWKDLGKVCGRDTPPTFNSTSNRMKVMFRSNEAIQGDGFRAVWHENCGGIFEVTHHRNIITSPSYPNFYPPNFFCNYTLVAPGKSIIIKFKEFQIEHNHKECRFDNLTIKHSDGYSTEENIWCGENKPPMIKSSDSAEIIFRTDQYIQRSGFTFEYYINDCDGTITQPGKIESLLIGGSYFGKMQCVWRIQAPADKSVVLRFESFELEYSYRCMFDSVKIYEGLDTVETNRLAVLCGNLTEHLPIFKSNSSSMLVTFVTDDNRHYPGFSANVLFVKNAAAGCGGTIHLFTIQSQTFRTQKDATYDSMEDCHWNVRASEGKNIVFIINSMDIRNVTNKSVTGDNECTGDFLEVRDGAGPLSELLGRYCGNQPPPPILSSSNALWIRFVSDGTLEGAGIVGTLETVNSLCGTSVLEANNTKLVLTSPNYPNNYEPGTRCRWTIRSEEMYTERLRIRFLEFDVAGSRLCEDDYLQITDKRNRKYIEQGYGEEFVWAGNWDDLYYGSASFAATASCKYCSNKLPHDYYSYSTELDLTFKGSSTGHKGFKLEYSKANCDRNFTAEQGRIMHEGVNDCWITITASENHTISLYFNQFSLYDPNECTENSLQVYDGDFNGKLMASLCSMNLPSPIFSTGNKLSLHSRSLYHSRYEFYDITYTTTASGRGCGGRIFNYAGSFTSPLYPNEYRNISTCFWDVTVPTSMKAAVEFPVFDIGTKSTCNYNYNVVFIYDVTTDGEAVLANTYCGGDQPAPFVATSNRVIVKYISSMNNVGTGWKATFEGRAQ